MSLGDERLLFGLACLPGILFGRGLHLADPCAAVVPVPAGNGEGFRAFPRAAQHLKGIGSLGQFFIQGGPLQRKHPAAFLHEGQQVLAQQVQRSHGAGSRHIELLAKLRPAGGVLGKVIASTDMVNYITSNADVLSAIGIFFPFILAAILKCAQGSSTVAITTTAGIVAPMLEALGLGTPVLAALAVIAIGAGAMTVSHANDSYFWVVTNFGEMKVQDGYKTQTLGTLVIGLASMVGVFITWLFIH